MKRYGFIFMGDYLPEHTATFEHAGTRTSIYTVGSFEQAKPLVEKLYKEGYGALELCGAFSREMADILMEMTNREMAVGYMTHNPALDSAFEKFFAS